MFVCFAIWLIMVQDNDSAILAGKVILWISGLTSIWELWCIFRLIRSSGDWLIQITPDHVIWQAPSNIGQNSFTLPVNEISKLVTKIHKYSDSSDDENHYIEVISGEQYYLKTSFSGINLNKFIRSLEKIGIKHEKITIN